MARRSPRTLEGAVRVGGTRPGHVARAGNVAAAQGALLWIVGHMEQFSTVFGRATHIYQRIARRLMRQHFIAEGANLAVIACGDRIAAGGQGWAFRG